MSSGFVSENVLEEARKKRQEEWDKVSDQHLECQSNTNCKGIFFSKGLK